MAHAVILVHERGVMLLDWTLSSFIIIIIIIIQMRRLGKCQGHLKQHASLIRNTKPHSLLLGVSSASQAFSMSK
ncbi:hypothetical protein GGS21DRAFT_489698 [Xylaria nigripes]|nr:hypothetical protein GGS21DRAFT_489698 [Xylaria nigripes]